MRERITYIDAMRGLAMFMVVSWHVDLTSFDHVTALYRHINDALQIPLFFMISGFFIPSILKDNVWKNIADKFVHLVIPALLMLGIYSYIMDKEFISSLFNTWKGGYWFTMVLFGFIALYTVLSTGIKLLKMSERSAILTHLICALVIMYGAFILEKLGGVTIGLLSLDQYYRYPYFVAGALLFKHRTTLFNWLNNKKFILGVGFLIFTGYQCISFKYHLSQLALSGLSFVVWSAMQIAVFAGLLIIWQLFHIYPALSTDSKIGRFLTLMGKRSLDIYFLHYFFLPRIPSWGNYFASLNAPFIEYLCAIALAIPLVFASLGTGYILRLSPLTAKWLLGVKTARP